MMVKSKTEQREKGTRRLEISVNCCRRDSRWRGGDGPHGAEPQASARQLPRPQTGAQIKGPAVRQIGRLPLPAPKGEANLPPTECPCALGACWRRTIQQERYQSRPLNPFHFLGVMGWQGTNVSFEDNQIPHCTDMGLIYIRSMLRVDLRSIWHRKLRVT